jgi:hypothetical protein
VGERVAPPARRARAEAPPARRIGYVAVSLTANAIREYAETVGGGGFEVGGGC